MEEDATSMGIIANFLDRFRGEIFTIGYRIRNEFDESDCLIHENQHYLHIPVNDKYWYADPILFENDNRIYMFMEMYDRTKNKGVIGYSEVQKNGNLTSPQVVLEANYHLSYPFVFTQQNKIYMIPETNQNKCIEVYEAIEFPLKWERKASILEDIVTADTTLLEHDDTLWLFTSKHQDEELYGTELLLYSLEQLNEEYRLKPHPMNPIVTDISVARLAGRIINYGNKLIRPSQDCSNGDYGRALVFNEITKITKDDYSEVQIKKINPGDIDLTLKHPLTGVHTYGIHRYVEVIDIKYIELNFTIKFKKIPGKFLCLFSNVKTNNYKIKNLKDWIWCK